MPFGSSGQSVATAGVVCAVISAGVGTAINAGLFHKFQKLTPQTWRPESGGLYARGLLSRLVLGVGYPMLFAYTGMPQMLALDLGVSPWHVGLRFGVLCWAALARR
jgi:hypothetical protein